MILKVFYYKNNRIFKKLFCLPSQHGIITFTYNNKIGDAMRILIFTEVLAPYVSGISSYVDVLKNGLEELSHQVLIVTSSPRIKEA